MNGVCFVSVKRNDNDDKIEETDGDLEPKLRKPSNSSDKENRFECDLCGLKFTTKRNRDNHEKGCAGTIALFLKQNIIPYFSI